MTPADTASTMLQGSCLCGSVRWRLDALPESATACNCTACRRYGTLWAYGHADEDIHVEGITTVYVRSSSPGESSSLGFHFCPACGCVSYWRSLHTNAEGRRRMGVNLRLAEPDLIAHVPIHHFDGLDSWQSLPRDGRCIRDLWF